MQIGKPGEPVTRISRALPDRVEVRGRDLTGELMGRLTFTEFFHLLLTGREPTEDERFFLDVLLLSIAEHGLMPSNVAARMTLAADPIGSGLVSNLARPGGNLTGMSALASDLAGKRVELLKELVPKAKRAAVLWNPSNQSKVTEWKDTQIAAQSVALILVPVEAQTPAELDRALAAVRREPPDAMIAFTESFTLTFRERIGEFALANRLPMVAELREFAVVGALASYGTSRADLWRRSASYVVKILRGANPGDLPVEQPTRFDLVINLKTAKALGLDVPPSLLARADEVIE